MSNENLITRVYRETVASYGREGVDRPEAFESATATIMAEVAAGRFEIDLERAVRDQLRRVDEADGRNADNILKRAAYGEVPLEYADLDVIVTLGAGRRKPWAEVTVSDLVQMNEIRYRNFKQAKDSYSAFNAAYMLLREAVFEHQTFGAAFEAEAFPPAFRLGGVA